MESGALTESIDVAQVVLYVFWIFFAGLILYLRKEDKREGYPLVSDRSDHILVQGFPAMPEPKAFALAEGGHYYAPHDESDPRPIAARPIASFPGAPLAPTGDGMAAGVGPGSVAIRPDRPETLVSGEPRVRPLAFARDFDVAPGRRDPREGDEHEPCSDQARAVGVAREREGVGTPLPEDALPRRQRLGQPRLDPRVLRRAPGTAAHTIGSSRPGIA